MVEPAKKHWYEKLPHPYAVLFFIILFAAILTYIVPAGQYTRISIDTALGKRTVVDAASFKYLGTQFPTDLMGLFQSLPLNGLVLVSTPQELVSMIVAKAGNMASMMNVNILGLVENMAYVKCPHCDEQISLFGSDEVLLKEASDAGIKLLDKLPLDPAVTALVDSGSTEKVDTSGILNNTAEAIEALL